MPSPKPDLERFPACKHRVVHVIWVDSLFILKGWQSIKVYELFAKENSLVPHDTIGQLLDLNHDDGYVLVALNTRRDGAVANVASIPLVSVCEITDLESNKKLWPR